MTASEWLESTFNESIHAHEKELSSFKGSSWMNSIRHNLVTLAVRPWCVCKDGTILSIQGSRYHNSNPRRFTAKYNAIELGTVQPLNKEYTVKYYHETIPDYSEDDEVSKYNPHITHIYHHFLVSDLEDLVSSHGGILGNYFTNNSTLGTEHNITLEDYGIKESKL